MTIDGTEQVSAQDTKHALGALLEEVRACRICEADLPLGPRPVLRAHQDAPILVVGQAPGTRVHATGIPWNDPSGKRLRAWLGVDDETFYDPRRFAIIPMGFCYPGRHPRGGDLPPRPECAAQWHAALLAQLPKRRLTLLIGDYAQRYYLGKERKKTLTGTVRAWESYLPGFIPMPHPSPRNIRWLQINGWFETEVIPYARKRVRALLEGNV